MLYVDEKVFCPVEEASRIIGQKWTLLIVHPLLSDGCKRFCELQDDLGGVNPSTLSSRLKMLEDEGLVVRKQISTIPPHVEYRLSEKGRQLQPVIAAGVDWSSRWLCQGG
jgi:DNA-binding HxlR family transcriptional regulator